MAARTFGDAALPQAERNAATLAKRIMKTRPKRINRREIQRGAGLPGLRKAEKIGAAIDLLIEAGWLRKEPQRAGTTTGRQSKDFAVNPKLFTTEPDPPPF